MSDIKMSEHFEFGLCLEVRDGHIYNRYDEFTDKQAGLIEDAINNHDRMAEEIAELKGALKSLIETSESNEQQLSASLLEAHAESTTLKSAKRLLAKLNQEGEG